MPTIYCWNCGEQLEADDQFCSQCGAAKSEGRSGILTPATRRYIENLILADERPRPSEHQYRQLEHEIAGMLKDCTLLGQLDWFSLSDIAVPEVANETAGGHPEVSEDEAERLIGFLQLVRLVDEDVTDDELTRYVEMLDNAERTAQAGLDTSWTP